MDSKKLPPPADTPPPFPSKQDLAFAARRIGPKVADGAALRILAHLDVLAAAEMTVRTLEVAKVNLNSMTAFTNQIKEKVAVAEQNTENWIREYDALKAELAATLAAAQETKALLDLVTRGKSPCGHWSAYAVTPDGGKHVTCLQCGRRRRRPPAPRSRPNDP